MTLFCILLTSVNANNNLQTVNRADCEIGIRDESVNPAILPLLTSDINAWVLPEQDENIRIAAGGMVKLACPGFGFEEQSLQDSFFWTAK